MTCGANSAGPMRTFLVARAVDFCGGAAPALQRRRSALLTPVRRLPTSHAPVPAAASRRSTKTRFLSLGVGKSVVVDLPREAKDVLVADPKIANAVIRSAQRAYIIGVARRSDQCRVLRRRRPAGRLL